MNFCCCPQESPYIGVYAGSAACQAACAAQTDPVCVAIEHGKDNTYCLFFDTAPGADGEEVLTGDIFAGDVDLLVRQCA